MNEASARRQIGRRPVPDPRMVPGGGPWRDDVTLGSRRLAATDRAQRVDRFIAAQEQFPIVEAERFVHLVYRGEASDLVLRGDMLQSGTTTPMHVVAGTDLFYASFEIESDARLQYQFVLDFDESIPDPLNPLQSDSLVYPGRASLLLMPKAERMPLVREEDETPLRGRVEETTFESEEVRTGELITGGERKIWVYLPEGYDEGTGRYPTIYVLYGAQMLRNARFDLVLDRAIGRSIEPVIAVFVEVTSAYEYARSVRAAHRQALAEELVPMIDQRYRTIQNPGRRAVLGADEAGYFAVELGLTHPDTFGKVAAQSILAIEAGGSPVFEMLGAGDPSAVEFFLDWGRYDQRRPSDGTDVAGYSRRLRDSLIDRNYAVVWREWNDGSDLNPWAWRSADALEAFFGIENRSSID